MQILKDCSSPTSTWLDRAISIDPDPSLTATCSDELLPGCLPIKESDWEGVSKVPRICGLEVEVVQVPLTLLRLRDRSLTPLNGTPSDINGREDLVYPWGVIGHEQVLSSIALLLEDEL